MIDLRIEIDKKTWNLTHPNNFNELTPKQFLAFATYYFNDFKDVSSQYSAKLLLMQEFLQKKTGKVIRGRWYKAINDLVQDGIIDELIKLQDFIYEDETFNTWILKEAKLQGMTYYAPRNRFAYMSFGQFIAADMILLECLKSRNKNLMLRFCAMLYLQKNEEFTTKNLDQKIKIFKKLSPNYINAVLFNFASIRHWVTLQYPDVFDSEDKNSEQADSSDNRKSWLHIRSFVAKDAINYDKVDKLLLHDVLFDLNLKMQKK